MKKKLDNYNYWTNNSKILENIQRYQVVKNQTLDLIRISVGLKESYINGKYKL